MGSQISVQSSENIQTQVSNTVNTVLNEVNNELSSSASSEQTLVFKVEGDFVNEGKFSLDQTSQVQMSAFVENIAKTVSDVTSDITSSLDISSIIDAEMNQSGIILGQSQISMQISKIEQSFVDNLDNYVKGAITSKIKQSISASNTLEFIIDGNFTNTVTGDFKLSQSSVIESISNAISDSMVDSILTSSIANEATASTTMSTTMTQEGISEWAVLLLLLIPFLAIGAGGFMFILLLKLLLPIMLIILGIITIVQYRSAVYYTCENVSGTDNYIETNLDKDENVYINPEFRDIPEKTCNSSDEECVEFPEGYGDPETAYLIPEKQTEYDILLKELEDDDADKDKLEDKMASISENKSNWTCVNGSDPINDVTKSDKKILFFISAKNFSIWYGVGMIIAGVLISIILILTNKSSQKTSTVSQPFTQAIKGGSKKYMKQFNKFINNLI